MSTNELTLTPSQSPSLAKGKLVVSPSQSLGAVRRPVNSTGWREWLFTVDHKKLGIMYGVTAFFFFIVGGVEALLIRLQLIAPDGKVLNADQYNQMFTMHATTMVFLFVMPMASAFANYFIPLQIGARDVAFPRLNLASWYLFMIGGTLTLWALVTGGVDTGWTFYTPYSSTTGGRRARRASSPLSDSPAYSASRNRRTLCRRARPASDA